MKNLFKCDCPIFSLILRVALGGLFLWSGIAKMGNLEEFYRAAQDYQVLSPQLTQFYSVLLPWLEILAGAYLLAGLFTRFAAALTGGLLVSFIIAVSMVLSRGDSLDCGCFIGGSESTVSPDLLIRDILMLLVAVYLYFKPTEKFSLDGWLNRQ